MTTSSKRNFETSKPHCLTILSYDGLKKQIYLVEKRQSGLDTNYHDLESQRSPLLGNSDTDEVFSQYLDRELRKITLFYESQATELFEDIEDLEAQVAEQDEAEMRDYPEFDEEDEDEEDEDGEGDTLLQQGEVSKPRKKGVVIRC
jgi:phosphate transporter